VTKALLAFAMTLTAAVSPTPARVSQAPVAVRLAPDSISGVRNVARTVALDADMMSSGKSLGSYSARLQWDSTVVRLDSVRAGEYGTPLINYVHGGEVQLTQVNTGGRTGAFSLAQLHFRLANDTAGKRTAITLTVTDLTATDFTNLRTELVTGSGVARILPPAVIARFSPDSLLERVDFRHRRDLLADLAAAPGVLLGSYAARITWDSTVMVLDSVKAGDFAAPLVNTVNGAEIRLTAADGAGRGGTPFSLAQLYFRFVGETFPRQTGLALTVTEMHAALSFADLLPGTTARQGKAVIGGVLRGDIDLSGSVAALDAQVILLGVVGLALPAGARSLPHGDADCNGTLRALDAQIVLNFVVGNDVSQFCGGTIK
jgi:hypothetical protein